MSEADLSSNVSALPSVSQPEGAVITGKGRRGQARSGLDDCLSASEVSRLRQKAISRDTTEEIAEELSAALGLAQRIRSRHLYIDSAEDRMRTIFDCLLADKPKLLLARDERLRLQLEVYRKAGGVTGLLARISSGSTVALVFSALVMSLLVWTLMVLVLLSISQGASAFHLYFLSANLPTGVFFMDGRCVLVIVWAAFFGGVVSIATRMREFSRIRDLDPFSMFWTAMLKPLIGVVVSLFLLATLAGGIISFGFLGEDPFGLGTKVDPNFEIAVKTLYLLWVLGFLSGFSERFAWDFVERAQGIAAGGLSKGQTD
jgi:hypothetical protein